MRANHKRTAGIGLAAAALGYACLRPTEISVEITAAPALCGALETTVSSAAPGQVGPVAEASARVKGCPESSSKGAVGSIVIVPSGDKGARVEIRVVAAIGRSPEGCAPGKFAGCIEARRILRYVKHEPLPLPIELRESCVGVECASGTSCVDGGCFPYDPEAGGYCDPATGACVPADAGALLPDAGADATPGPCPTGRGPVMVRVVLPNATFCIDSTEVTDAQFAAFAATKPDPNSQIPACRWNTGLPPAPLDSLPIVQVNWCHANAFCAWAGKRLCKTLDGSRPFLNDASAQTSEWYLACSNGGQRQYPYGDTYDPEACKTPGAKSPDPNRRAVGLYPTCVGGFPGIFDLSGGVHEWVDGCDVDVGPNDQCRTEGSSYSHPLPAEHACSFAEASADGGYDHRTASGDDVGFRCCAD